MGSGNPSSDQINELLLELDQLDRLLQNHNTDAVRASVDAAWLLYSGFLVFFMQTGFAMLEAGAVRSKNVRNLLLKNIVDFSSTTLCFFMFGYALAFGTNDNDRNQFVGTNLFFLHKFDGREEGADLSHVFFILTFATAAGTIMSGAMAERTKLLPYVVLSSLTASITDPFIMHWTWDNSGWLSPRNVDPLFNIGNIDFAGSGVVHLTGGVAALVAAIMLGPRLDETGVPRFTEGCRTRDFVGHSITFSALGVLILWVGWYGFNAGSVSTLSDNVDVAARILVTTTLSASASMVVTFGWNVVHPPFNMMGTLNGILAGLVAIAGPCAVVDHWAAIVIGVVAGAVNIFLSWLLVRMKIDDPLEASALHGGCGLWGVVASGLFAEEAHILRIYHPEKTSLSEYGLFLGGNGNLLAAQLVGGLVTIAWAGLLTFLMFSALERIPAMLGRPEWGGVRAERQAELDGLDVAYHDGFLYPAFLVPVVEALNRMWKLQSQLAQKSTHIGSAIEKVGGELDDPSQHGSLSYHPTESSERNPTWEMSAVDTLESELTHSSSRHSVASAHEMLEGDDSTPALVSMRPRFIITDVNQRRNPGPRMCMKRFKAKQLSGRQHGSVAAKLSLRLSANGKAFDSLVSGSDDSTHTPMHLIEKPSVEGEQVLHGARTSSESPHTQRTDSTLDAIIDELMVKPSGEFPGKQSVDRSEK